MYRTTQFALQCEERTYAVAESLDTVLPVLGALLAVTQASAARLQPLQRCARKARWHPNIMLSIRAHPTGL